MSQISEKFGIPKTLLSDSVHQFVNDDLKQWCESMGIKKWSHLPNNQDQMYLLSDRWNGLFNPSDQIWKCHLAFHKTGFDDTPEHFQDAAILLSNYFDLCLLQTNNQITNNSHDLHYTQNNEHFIHSAREFKQESAC